jgi:hypothetical protein
MSRDPLQTVTLPIVVEAEKHDEIDGTATLFPSANRTTVAGLRVVTKADIWQRLEKWKRSQPEIRRLCGGILAMRLAYDARDEAAFRRALENVWKWVPHFGKATVRPLKNEEMWRGTNGIYSGLMANLLQSSRLIFLHTNTDRQPLRPSLFCPNWETAAFAFIGSGFVRECPKCHEIFIPKSENQDYCIPAHGVAHRTARSRARAKQRADEKKTEKAQKALRRGKR